ncbi:hypothetical protein Enr13x_39820 [Stieleria neptunia]|uniref:Uncharacterized protein n=2 Tax=Stieleria neptunia TaxID=2527979 RepID=A0A518HTD0_9BACT|nr:hypothetical protein Enr13x_39820 [Stieleria neptunia]
MGDCGATCHCQQSADSAGKTAAPQCPVQPIRTSPLLGQLKPNRVLIVVPLDRQDRLKEQMALMQDLAGALRAKAGVDVVESPRRVCEACFPIHSGRFDERKLVELGNQYFVDTVLYCNIESIDAYSPMRLEVQFLAINVAQSVAIVSGAHTFDLADPAMSECFFAAMNADPKVDTTLKNSPTRLIDFGASRLAAALAQSWK